jgi:hypothetical protein
MLLELLWAQLQYILQLWLFAPKSDLFGLKTRSNGQEALYTCRCSYLAPSAGVTFWRENESQPNLR